MKVKYLVKELNNTIGIIFDDNTYIRNKSYNPFFIPKPLDLDRIKDPKVVINFLESRVVARESDMCNIALKALGLVCFDVDAIIRRTRGQLITDSYWLALNPKEKWEDISIKLNGSWDTSKGLDIEIDLKNSSLDRAKGIKKE